MVESLIEVVKYSIPALIVFGRVYYLFRGYLGQQYQLESLKFRQDQSKNVIPLKLQAYERLMVFCERISLENSAYRLSNADMGVVELRSTMLIAIQQEYEHNISQQLYVSLQLWQIIQLTKDQVQDCISRADGRTNLEFLANANSLLNESKSNPILVAKGAIKNEAELILQNQR